jgi:hypothetical protein
LKAHRKSTASHAKRIKRKRLRKGQPHVHSKLTAALTKRLCATLAADSIVIETVFASPKTEPFTLPAAGREDPRQVIAALGTAFPGIRWVIQVMVTHQDSI